MQQPGPIFPVVQSFPPTNITTEQIQKYLDENKKLILAILDNQNLGKLAECAQYQAQLQKNLMYLAAIADAQPQTSAMPPQMTPHPAMQQGAFYMPYPQAAAMAQQAGIFPTRAPFNSPHPMQDLRQQLPQPPPHPHATQAYSGATNGMHPAQTEANLGVSRSIPSSKSGPTDTRGVNKQDKPDTLAQQAGIFPTRASFNSPHPMQDLRQQLPQPPPHPHATQAYAGATNGMHPAQTEANLGVSRSIPSSKSGPTDTRGVNKQDEPDTCATARSDVKRSSNVAHGSSHGPEAK